MDEDNLKSWASQPDVCRCCLSTCGMWDLTGSYITEAGVKEVYSDMLQHCFGVSLSALSDWGPSRLVCSMCVGHLKDANAFKKKVLQAEQYFVSYHNNKKDVEDTIKSEDVCYALSPECNRDEDADTKNTDVDNDFMKTEDLASKCRTDLENENDDLKPIEKPEINKQTRKRHKILARTQRKITKDGSDSDTPISELKSYGLRNKAEKCVEVSKENESCVNITKADTVSRQHSALSNKKQISERKRLMLTCNTVLKDTTACPFRHHKSWFQCFFCQQDFMEINLLRTHTLATHKDIDKEIKSLKRYPRSLQIEISNLQCRRCELNLTDVEGMSRHFGEVHKMAVYSECIADYKVDGSPYTCHLCKQEFHVFRTLTTHLNEHYANCICDVCGKSFLNSKRLKVHKRTHESGQFPCSECGKVLKTRTSKANHMESAHSKRIIKCQICFKPMKHYNDRIKHMSDVHNITHKFKCPICGREYNIKHYLATHIRQTHGHKNKKCLECGMAFITNHGLKKHMLRHSGEKPFSCNVCWKSYARSYTLKEHMRCHEGEGFGCA